jgi:tripartite-type tricarboxylate transporter receptor subunit TctC
VDLAFSAYPSLSGAIASHRVNLVAVNSLQRSAQAPDAPPIADWIPGFDFAPIIGIIGRTGTPQAIVDKVAAEAVAAVQEAEVIKALAMVGVEPVAGGPGDYVAALKAEVARVAEAVRVAGIKPQ